MATMTQTTTATDGAGRALRRTLWGFQILLAAFLLFASALPKFAGQADAMETFAKIGWGGWFRYFTGAVEAAGAIGLMVPRLAGAAATGLIGLMVGAALTHVLVLGTPAWAALPAVFGAILAVVAWDRRAETRELLASLKR